MNKVDFLEKNLERLLLWIQACDGRLAWILPFSTVMLGTLVALITSSKAVSYWDISLSAIAIILLILSIICFVIVSFPRIKCHYPNSLIYFGGIALRTFKKLKLDIEAMTEENYIHDLIEQCYINSLIANKKFKWLKRGMRLLFASALPWLLVIANLYGIK